MGKLNNSNKSRRALTAAAVSASVSLLAIPSQGAGFPALETKDKVSGRVGVFKNGSIFTPDAGGRSGAAGDLAVDFGRANTGPVYIQDGTFLNSVTANDKLTVAFWQKKYDVAAGSAFWFNSTASNNGNRGFQAHVPWSDSTIYFDSSGCCGADTQRINLNISNYANYTGDPSFWQEWHHFAFVKNGEVKEIYIDGELFHTGGGSPLPTDFTDLAIGGQATGAGTGSANMMHGIVDDFAIFGAALDAATIANMAKGASPSTVPASNNLIALWDFNDAPSGGQFVTISPAPGAASASPDLIQIVHLDGSVAWTAANVSLTVDGVPVTPTFTKDGNRAVVAYKPSPLFAIQSTHKAALTYPIGGGQNATSEWEFTVGGYTKDSVASRIGAFRLAGTFSADGQGQSGAAGDRSVDLGAGAGSVFVGDASFLNEASKNDEMSFSLWVYKRNIVDGSAFWANSPSSGGGRGWQAHVPWSNNNVYFDTAGCCDGTTQRINAGMDIFSEYSGDVSWWNDWHHFVFTKKADLKQIWIDGKIFLEGSSLNVLPTDFTTMYIGADGSGNGRLQGRIDDFAVYATALAEADIVKLATRAARPNGLGAGAKLLAAWEFNDFPAEGLFGTFSPADKSTGAAPNLIRAIHFEGASPWDKAKVSLAVDGSPVAANVTQENGVTTVSYVPSPLFAPLSQHTATLTYPVGGGTATRTWSFTVGTYTRDTVGGYVGILQGPTKYTDDAGGASGQPGDYGMEIGKANATQGVWISNASFLNQASANDEMAIVAWQKLYAVANSAMFWGVSPSSSGSQRGFSVHTPWSNNNLYFDTAGCCDGATQRINAGIDIFPGYSGAQDWWQSWHHLVFQKKGSLKQIWIDGELFLEGDNTNPLPTDFTEAYLGADRPDNAHLLGLIDDFAVFGTILDDTAAKALFTRTKTPATLPASQKLIAYFNFNDVPTTPTVGPTLKVTRSGNNLTITSDPQPLAAGFVLETAPAVTGPWTPQAGANTPLTVQIGSGSATFLRAVKR